MFSRTHVCGTLQDTSQWPSTSSTVGDRRETNARGFIERSYQCSQRVQVPHNVSRFMNLRSRPQGGAGGSRPFPSYPFPSLPGQRAKRARHNTQRVSGSCLGLRLPRENSAIRRAGGPAPHYEELTPTVTLPGQSFRNYRKRRSISLSSATERFCTSSWLRR
jgi:hypothetical protein